MNTTTVRDLALAGTMPSGLALTMLREMAEAAMQYGLPGDDTVREAMAAAAHRNLVLLGYRPPENFTDRWQTLLTRLTDFARWVEAGPDAGEQELTEDDWSAMIRDELAGLAGRPL